MKIIRLLLTLVPYVAAIWPLPRSYTHGTTDLWINRDVKFEFKRPATAPVSFQQETLGAASTPSNDSSPIVQTAIRRFYDVLESQAFVPWKFYPRRVNFEPTVNSSVKLIHLVTLVQTKPDISGVIRSTEYDIDESYALDVKENGEVCITAQFPIGLAYGLTTLSQLFFAHTNGGLYTRLAPVRVSDRPKFRHRGLNFDVSRVYYPVPDILRTIDALAFNKFNRLHLHITDAQSWPLEIPSLPELARRGAYTPGETYTSADLEHIQAYGAERGVMVYLEIDMPGHTASIHLSHPELITAYNQQPDWPTYSAEPPSGSLKLKNSHVQEFLSKMWDDLLPRVARHASLFHTGGDEVNFNTYLLDHNIHSNTSKVLKPLLQSFIDKTHAHLRAHDLTPIVWEEMLLKYNLSLGADVIVQTWKSDEAVLRTVQRGHRAIAGNSNYLYLDCGKGDWVNFAPGRASKVAWPYLDYCNPRKNWRLIYSYDPVRGVPPNLHHLVLGCEAHIWSEQTDSANLDSTLWPRLSAAGEVFWRGQPEGLKASANLSQTEASPRLADMRERLLGLGVRAEPVHMPFCTMHKDSCVLS